MGFSRIAIKMYSGHIYLFHVMNLQLQRGKSERLIQGLRFVLHSPLVDSLQISPKQIADFITEK